MNFKQSLEIYSDCFDFTLPKAALRLTERVTYSDEEAAIEKYVVTDRKGSEYGAMNLSTGLDLLSGEEYLFVENVYRTDVRRRKQSKGIMLAGYVCAAALSESRDMRLSCGITTSESALKIWKTLENAGIAIEKEAPIQIRNMASSKLIYRASLHTKRVSEITNDFSRENI